MLLPRVAFSLRTALPAPAEAGFAAAALTSLALALPVEAFAFGAAAPLPIARGAAGFVAEAGFADALPARFLVFDAFTDAPVDDLPAEALPALFPALFEVGTPAAALPREATFFGGFFVAAAAPFGLACTLRLFKDSDVARCFAVVLPPVLATVFGGAFAAFVCVASACVVPLRVVLACAALACVGRADRVAAALDFLTALGDDLSCAGARLASAELALVVGDMTSVLPTWPVLETGRRHARSLKHALGACGMSRRENMPRDRDLSDEQTEKKPATPSRLAEMVRGTRRQP